MSAPVRLVDVKTGLAAVGRRDVPLALSRNGGDRRPKEVIRQMPHNGNGNGSAVAVRQEAPVAPVRETPAELKAIKDLYAKDLTQTEWDLFCAEARHRRLSIVKGHMVAVKRKGRVVHQVTIHGARHLAERSQLYAGSEGPFWCGADGVWKDVWLDAKPPAAAKFVVYRYDSPHSWIGIAVYEERVQTYWKDGKEQLVETWAAMPAHMLAKVAESDALKRARLLEDDIQIDLGPLPGEYSPKVMALRRLHAVGAERGLDHGGVREVVRAIAPGTESLASEAVGPRELNSAATFVEDADDCDLTGAVAGMVELKPLPSRETLAVDPATGEILDLEPAVEPMSPQQAQAIRAQGLRKKLSTEDLETLLGGANWADVLTHDEAAQWIAYLGKATIGGLRDEITKAIAELANS